MRRNTCRLHQMPYSHKCPNRVEQPQTTCAPLTKWSFATAPLSTKTIRPHSFNQSLDPSRPKRSLTSLLIKLAEDHRQRSHNLPKTFHSTSKWLVERADEVRQHSRWPINPSSRPFRRHGKGPMQAARFTRPARARPGVSGSACPSKSANDPRRA